MSRMNWERARFTERLKAGQPAAHKRFKKLNRADFKLSPPQLAKLDRVVAEAKRAGGSTLIAEQAFLRSLQRKKWT